MNGELVCSRLSLSELSAVSMPNPDVTSNWAPHLRKAGTLLWCCKQVGQAEPLPLAVCCRVQKERERKVGRIREKKQEGSGLIALGVPKIIFPLLSNWHNTNQLPFSSGAELSLSAQNESAFPSPVGLTITWLVQKEFQQAE